MQLLRRKSALLASVPITARQGSSVGRKGGNLSVSVAIFTVFLFVLFIYDDDVKTTIAVFPFSGPPAPGRSHPADESPVIQETAVDKSLLSSNNVRAKKPKKAPPPKKKGTPVITVVEEIAAVVVKEDKRSCGSSREQLTVQHEEVLLEPPEDEKVALPILKKELKEKAAAMAAEIRKTVASVAEGCDFYDGWWVYDNVTRPLYKEPECEFLTEQVTCMRNGRTDDAFQKWRWQPRGCSLPDFDARVLLERLRGKRLMFVGDSLNRNQWESMVCLVQSVIPRGKKKLVKEGSFNIFTAMEYNATVEFYWSPFLVESNSDDPRKHSILDRIIMPESIAKHGANWKDADYLVFNTYIWWMNTDNMKVLRGSFEEGSTEYDEVDRPEAYERVLRTWAAWVNNNVDPRRTTVFFSSVSPLHIKPKDWDNPEGIKCALEKLPIFDWKPHFTAGTDWRMHAVALNVTRSMAAVPVSFVDVTRLSEFRKDAHTSVHTLRQGKLLTAEQQADPANFADCIHWCLPGLPDTWNEFIYARIASAPWRD